MVYTGPEIMATPLPYLRFSADTDYLQIQPGVQSDDYIYDNPKAGESAVKGLALDSTNRFVVKTLPAGAVGDVAGPAGATDNAITRYDGTSGKLVQNSTVRISDGGDMTGVNTINGSAIPSGGFGIGDVAGPASATDNAVARYDSTTGKLIQNSVVVIGDTGDITGVGTINGSTVPSPIGDVRGPASAVANRVATYNGTSGKLIQDSGFTVSGTGALAGTNTGDVTLAAVGTAPNANAATLTGQALRLQPASGSFPGVVTTANQAFAGTKTFADGIILNSAVFNTYSKHYMSTLVREGGNIRAGMVIWLERIGSILFITLEGIPDDGIQFGGLFVCETPVPPEYRPPSYRATTRLSVINSSSSSGAPFTVLLGAMTLGTDGILTIGEGVDSNGDLFGFYGSGTSGDGNGILMQTCMLGLY
jgi:hypothetical protein